MKHHAPVSTAELDALIATAERNVVETDRRIRSSADALQAAWRGRTGDVMRRVATASVVVIGAGFAYGMWRVAARRRHDRVLSPAMPTPAAPARAAALPHRLFALAVPALAIAAGRRPSAAWRGALPWWLGLVQQVVSRVWRVAGRRARPKPVAGVDRRPTSPR